MKNPISPIIKERVPQFIKENYPNLFKILSDYYDWIEDDNYLVHLEDFIANSEANLEHQPHVDMILNELGCTFADRITEDKKIIINTIRDFYLSRGNSYSLEYLFRALFNEWVEIDYPRKRMMYLSSADYSSISEILITADSLGTVEHEQVFSFEENKNLTVFGFSSGVEGYAGGFQPLLLNGTYFIKLLIDQNTQEFIKDETVRIRADSGVEILEKIVDTITLRQITQPGNGYLIGDEIIINGCLSNGKILVSNITRGSVVDLEIVAAGSGYSVGDSLSAATTGSGMGFFGKVTGIGNSGEVTNVEILNQGYEYDLIPEIIITSQSSGTGCSIRAIGRRIGGIKEITIEIPYWKMTPSSSIQYTINSLVGSGASIEFSNSGCIFNQKKTHKNSLGVLGFDCIIPDNLYFQEYSYEIKSPVSPKNFNDLVDEFIHPVGLMRYSILDKEIIVDYNINCLERIKFKVNSQISDVGDLKIEDVSSYRFNRAEVDDSTTSSNYHRSKHGDTLSVILYTAAFKRMRGYFGEFSSAMIQTRANLNSSSFFGDFSSCSIKRYPGFISNIEDGFESVFDELHIPAFQNQISFFGDLVQVSIEW